MRPADRCDWPAKQRCALDDEPLFSHDTLGLDTGPADCVVVCAQVPDAVSVAVEDLDCRCIPCTDAGQGLSQSLRCGLRALSPSCSAALILLTDQPGVDLPHLQALLGAWQGDPGQAAASGYAGRVGVPAVIPRAWFAALMKVSGDIGARELLRARSAEISVVAAAHLQHDIDHPRDLDETFRSS